MGINTYKKGKRRELEAQKLLEKDGYLTMRQNHTRYGQNDFFGLFDIVSLKRDGSEIRLIQVKSNISDFYSARKDILDWMSLNEISNIDCEVWLREDRCPWRKETICLH